MDLDELLRRQAGVVTTAQALACGTSPRQLRGGGRELVRLRRGVYARVGSGLLLPERTALDVAAERLLTQVDLVAVGATAALLHELPLLGRRPVRPQLAEAKHLRPQHHGASREVAGVVVVHGVPVETVAWAVADVARRRGFAAGVVAADAALARGVARLSLEDAVAGGARWPGNAVARRVVDFADGRSESALESLGRVRLHEQGLPAPDLQVEIRDADGLIGRVDQLWAEHRTVAEADGRLKYTDPAALFEEKRREDRLRDAGFEVVRYTWDEVLRHPQLVAARVLRAFSRTATRRAA